MTLNAQSVGETVRKALLDTAKTTIDEFAEAAVTAFGAAALAYVRSCGDEGAAELGSSAAKAYAHSLRDELVDDADAEGITVGDVHVATQLARFASGDPAVRTPIGTVSVEHCYPFPVGAHGGLTANGKLTLHADFTLDETTDRIAVRTWGKIELTLGWTTEPKSDPSP
jgi:hypothetical protein